MTSKEWFAATDPLPLLHAMFANHDLFYWQVDAYSVRQRFFACACARQAWDLLTTDARSAVQASERYVSFQASETELLASAIRHHQHVFHPVITAAQHAAVAAQAASSIDGASSLIRRMNLTGPFFDPSIAARAAAQAVACHQAGPAPRITIEDWHRTWTAAFNEARAIQADYLRDIVPPPRYTPQRQAKWLTSTVLALAQQMSQTGDYSTMPILSDALEDAGCQDWVILSCCRSPGRHHVRGNWVIDLLLAGA